MSTPFDRHWLEMGACVPVDIETMAALVSEIHRLIDVIGGMALATREWVGLTDDEIKAIVGPWGSTEIKGYTRKLFDQIEAALKEKNT